MLNANPQKGRIFVDTPEGQFVFKPFEFFSEGFASVPYNEEFAYDISTYLGLNIVPVTVLREARVQLGNRHVVLRGSMQSVIDGDIVPLSKYKGRINEQQATEIFVFDTLIGNTDRTEDSVLVDNLGNLWAIDNGFSLGFHAPSEKAKRAGQDSGWDVSMYSIEDCNLGFPSRIWQNVDEYRLEPLIKQVAAPDFFEGLQYSGNSQNILWQEIVDMLRHRIKYLPTLLWKQLSNNKE